MPERDWIADEISLQNAGNANAKVIALAALDERRRLAEELHLADGVARLAIKHRDLAEAMLTWKPGPPTEPGDYIVRWKRSPAQYCRWAAEDLRSPGALLPLIEWHLGPLPEPQKAEVKK